MSARVLLLAVALSAGCTGCGTFWQDAARNLTEAPIRGLDELREDGRNRRLARAAWDEVRRSTPGAPYSSDYEDGFKAGFADHLEGGGNGQPPALPPFCYRLTRYQTPEGHRAIEEW